MMRRVLGYLVGLSVVLSVAGNYAGAALAKAPEAVLHKANKWFNPNPKMYLFENMIKPGMVGYGLTVVHGAQIQKFHVRVVDVIKNFGPDMNVILVRCRGLGLSKSGIVAGMSGSPVYIDGKLIGAIAYGWNFSKDPIGGVQPIRQMLRIPLPKPGVAAPHGALGWAGAPGRVRGLGLDYAIAQNLAGWGPLAAHIESLEGRDQAGIAPEQRMKSFSGGLVPLASPLMVSGASSTLLRYLDSEFGKTSLVPMAAGAAGAAGPIRRGDALGGLGELKAGALRLQPGSAIGVPLLSGDADMGAIGTVTTVVGNRVYAFGHRFFAQGTTRLPISTAYIYTILPSVQESFKIGSTDRVTGRLVMDQETGIVGELGRTVARVPVSVQMANSSGTLNKTFHYTLYPNINATVGSAGAAILASLTAHQKPKGLFTLHVTGSFDFTGTSVPFDHQVTNGDYSTKSFMKRLLLPLGLMIDNPFKKLKLTGIHVRIFLEPTNREAQITSVTVQRRVVAPGDMVTARVRLLEFNGSPRLLQLQLKVPKNTPNGRYHLVVGSSRSALEQAFEYFPQQFAPESFTTLKRAIGNILAYRNNRLYARLVLNPGGIAVGTHEYPGLPASRRAMEEQMAPDQTVPLFNEVHTSIPADAVVSHGGASFIIRVLGNADDRFGSHLPAPGHIPHPGIPAMRGRAGT